MAWPRCNSLRPTRAPAKPSRRSRPKAKAAIGARKSEASTAFLEPIALLGGLDLIAFMIFCAIFRRVGRGRCRLHPLQGRFGATLHVVGARFVVFHRV